MHSEDEPIAVFTDREKAVNYLVVFAAAWTFGAMVGFFFAKVVA